MRIHAARALLLLVPIVLALRRRAVAVAVAASLLGVALRAVLPLLRLLLLLGDLVGRRREGRGQRVVGELLLALLVELLLQTHQALRLLFDAGIFDCVLFFAVEESHREKHHQHAHRYPRSLVFLRTRGVSPGSARK